MRGRRARPKQRVIQEIERVLTPLQARGLEFLLAKGDPEAKELEIVGARASLIKEFGKTKGAHIWLALRRGIFVTTGDRVGKMAKATIRRHPYRTVEGPKIRRVKRKSRGTRRKAHGDMKLRDTLRSIIDRFDTAMAEVDACQELLARHDLMAVRNENGKTSLFLRQGRHPS